MNFTSTWRLCLKNQAGECFCTLRFIKSQLLSEQAQHWSASVCFCSPSGQWTHHYGTNIQLNSVKLERQWLLRVCGRKTPTLSSLLSRAVARLQTTRADYEDVVLHSNLQGFSGEIWFKAYWKFCVRLVKAKVFTGNVHITSLIFRVANQGLPPSVSNPPFWVCRRNIPPPRQHTEAWATMEPTTLLQLLCSPLKY